MMDSRVAGRKRSTWLLLGLVLLAVHLYDGSFFSSKNPVDPLPAASIFLILLFLALMAYQFLMERHQLEFSEGVLRYSRRNEEVSVPVADMLTCLKISGRILITLKSGSKLSLDVSGIGRSQLENFLTHLRNERKLLAA